MPKWLNRLRCRLGCQHAGGYAQGNTILSGSWIPTERDTFGRSHSGMPTLACGRYSQMYSLEDSSNVASGYQSTVATCCDLSATYRRVQCAWPLCQQCRRCRKAQTVGNDRCTAVGWLDTALPMARNTHTHRQWNMLFSYLYLCCSQVCRAQSMKLSGVRPSVCPIICPLLQWVSCWVPQQWHRSRQITLSSKCKQCHVVSWCTKLNADFLLLLLREFIKRKIAGAKNALCRLL